MIYKEIALVAARTNKPNYRPDIDGLRAVAVLIVVAFHIGTRFIKGGFVGVDIFFVISGYLITKIIFKELKEGRFSITAFYVRRVRRIAPALVAVLVIASAVAYSILLPSELMDYARSLIAAVLSISNFYFWSQSGYFDGQSLSKPLLHTWSLAVEEQFYLFFPLLLAFIFRRNPRWIKPGLGLLAIGSFAFSVWAVAYAPSLAFYWPLTRIWELMCGSLLAIGAVPEMRSPASQNAASLVGFGLICYSAAFYTNATPFPGVLALAPCLGTTLIIAAGTHGKPLVNRMLSLPPVVFIGLISYSLYLWHWPVIVFHSMGLGFEGASANVQKLLLGLTSVLLGTLSWRFVERPFRSGNKETSSGRIFGAAAACVAVPTLVACAFLLGNGFAFRFPPRAILVASYLASPKVVDRWHYRSGSCFITSGNTFSNFDRSSCLAPDSAKPQYLILGDSHAAHLWYGLSTVFPADHMLQATASGCKPFLHPEKNYRKDCVEVIEMALQDYLPHSHLKAVILGGDWAESDIPKIAETLAYIKSQGIEPILFGPAVQYDAPLPRLLALAIRRSDPEFPQRHQLPSSRALDLRMAALAKNSWDVRYVSYFQALCDGADCTEYAAPDVPLQGDVAHFTAPGSVFFATRLKSEGALD